MNSTFSKNTKNISVEFLRKYEQYQNLFKHANDAILVIEPENETVLEVNDKACEMYGFEIEDFIGLSLRSISKDVEYGDAQRRKLVAVGTYQEFETVQFRADGTPIHLHINAAVIEYEGQPAILSINRDITERKQTEQALEEAAKRERAMIENAVDVICTVDVEGRFVTVNPACFKLWGYQPEELIGRQYIDLVAPEDVPKTNEVAASIMSGVEATNFENRYQHKNGTYVNVRWTSHWSESEQLMFAVAHDITERKLIEERQSAILNALPAHICLLDNEGNILEVNNEWKQFALRNDFNNINFGIGRNYIEMCEKATGGNAEGAKQIADVCRSVLSGESSQFEMEYPCHSPNEKRWFKLTVTSLHKEKSAGAVVMHVNTTERKLAEEKIRESEEWMRTIFDGSRDGIVIEDEDKVVYANKSFAQLFEYDVPEDLIGKHISELVSPEEVKRLMEFSQMRLRGEDAPSVYEFKGKRRSGTLIELEAAVSTSVVGGKKHIMTAIRDITERKQAANLLQKNLSLLTSTFEATADGILVVNRNNKVKTFNEKFAEMWSIPKDLVLEKDTARILAFVSEQLKDAENIRKRFEKSFQKPDAVQFDVLELKDGKFYERYSIPQMLEGKVVGRVLSYRDITERKRADAALRESEYKLRTLLTSMNEGLLQVDEKDSIVFVNSCFSEMVGFSQEELIGKNWSRLLLDNEGIDFISEVNKRRSSGISDRYELCLKKKSGETLFVMVSGVPILDAEEAVTGSMGVFTDITTRKRIEEQLLHDAFHDGLTGLANRALFMDHLRLTIERGKSRHSNLYAVLFLDFDRFKVINDSLGHGEGDKLLKFIARRLESATRTGDLVARLGGDEFVVLLSELLEEGDAVQIAERIQASLKNPFDLNGNDIFISASIGIALSTSKHKRPEDMVRDADIAMYSAKAKGKARYQIFDQAMHERASKQLQFETEMRRALENQDFLLHYQPIMHLETETLVGFESLVRWKHAERDMIPPLEFIPAAEENNLILPLGQWILEESCRQLREWQENNPAAANLLVSVNLSCKQFVQPDLAEQIAATLKKTGLDPHCLKLEITESHIMENSEKAATMMNDLRALGVELSLDDFGTGYSSLSYLHRLPVSNIKIDRSFVTRMIESEENSEIVQTIIRLAQNLKLKVVAEGIETAEQLAHLKNLNCEYGQGYFFSKPLTAEAAKMFFEKRMTSPMFVTDAPVINHELNM